MSLGPDHQPATEFGLVPKLLTAVPVAALCVTGVIYTVDRDPSVPVAATVTTSVTPTPQIAGPTVPPGVPSPALQVTAPEQAPASVWSPSIGAGLKVASAAAAWSDIPSVAQVAYQRAASVINSASPTCKLDWSLLAAVGKVESDHGRSGGSQLSATGVAAPPIIGPALDGTGATAHVADTDGGHLDGDASLDHAIGPMQFLPATWSTVGVDGDGDGLRNPQDIDDAALAAAVYLCAGGDDLSTPLGQNTALLRYNHSATYADSVRSAATSYQSGFASTPYVPTYDTGVSTRVVTPVIDEGADDEVISAAPVSSKKKGMRGGLSAIRGNGAASNALAGAKGPSATPTATPSDDPSTDPGAGDPSTGPSGPGTPGPSDPPSTDPGGPTGPGTDPGTDPGTGTGPSDGTDPSPTPASASELGDLCTPAVAEEFSAASAEDRAAAVSACVEALKGKTLADATAALPGVLADLPAAIPALTNSVE